MRRLTHEYALRSAGQIRLVGKSSAFGLADKIASELESVGFFRSVGSPRIFARFYTSFERRECEVVMIRPDGAVETLMKPRYNEALVACHEYLKEQERK